MPNGFRARTGRYSRDWTPSFIALIVAFLASQIIDFTTAQNLALIEPKGAFAEANPVLRGVTDPVVRLIAGLVLKVGLVILVVGISMLQPRRAIATAILLVGVVAGMIGAWTNLNPWWRS
jgi:hypothetical protein